METTPRWASPRVFRGLTAAWLAMLAALLLLEACRQLHLIPLGTDDFLLREARHNFVILGTCVAFFATSALIVLVHEKTRRRPDPTRAPVGAAS